MRWVLIKPKTHSPYYDPEVQEPLGLEYLSAWLRAAGHDVLLLDVVLSGADERKLGRRAAAFRPDAIGFSLTTAQDVDSMLAIHREAAASLNGASCRWLAGGNYVSTEPDHAADQTRDGFTLVRWEGELALDALMRRWSEPGEGAVAPASPGLIDGPGVVELDALPFPDRPFATEILANDGAFNLQGSRGCCGACRYCASPGMRSTDVPSWRGRSPSHVVDEIETLAGRFGARSFNFVDEDFLGPNRLAPQRASAFAAELRGRGLEITFSIQVRPASLSDEVIDTLADAGLVYAFLGIESDDPADHRRWARPWTDDPWRFVSRLQRRGVGVNAGVLLFHSHATLDGIERFARRLHHYHLLEYRSATNRLDAMPGSCFHRLGLADGSLDAEVVGPQPLPFRDRAVAALHRDLLWVLAPLGPPAMHALCALPPLLAARRFGEPVAERCQRLQELVRRLDDDVAECFFALLDAHQHDRAAATAPRLRREADGRARTAVDELVDGGFAPSADALHDAIAIDAGTGS